MSLGIVKFKLFLFWLLWSTQSILINGQDIKFPEDKSSTDSRGCTTPTGKYGICDAISRCPDLISIIQKSTLTTKDRNFLRQSICSLHQKKVKVCCPFKNPPTTTRQSRVNVLEIEESKENLLPVPGRCGQVGIAQRVLGGNNAEIGEFPWMALIEYSKPDNKSGFHCSGNLINRQYILTAAHCVHPNMIPAYWDLKSVRLGEWKISTKRDCFLNDCSESPIDVTIEDRIIHSDFRSDSKHIHHDIALLRLSEKIFYTDWIKPICLPVAKELRSSFFENEILEISGWGQTDDLPSSDQKIKAPVKGVNLKKCQQIFRQYDLIINQNQLCAGGEEGVDSCVGDSGGPLIGVHYQGLYDPYYFLAGIISYGMRPCGQADIPGIYTRIGAYIDWIIANIH